MAARFARSSVAKLAGGRTRWSGAIAGLVVLAFLPFAGILTDLPTAILGAIVIAAVARLIRLDQIIRIWQFSKPQAAVAGVTFFATLVLSPRIDIAVLLGIGLGVAVHLIRELRTNVESSYVEGKLTLRMIGVMYFGSTPAMQAELLFRISEHPEAHTLEIDMEQLGRIDFTGATALKTFVEDVQHAGLHVTIVNVPPHAKRIIGRVFASDIIRPVPEA